MCLSVPVCTSLYLYLCVPVFTHICGYLCLSVPVFTCTSVYLLPEYLYLCVPCARVPVPLSTFCESTFTYVYHVPISVYPPIHQYLLSVFRCQEYHHVLVYCMYLYLCVPLYLGLCTHWLTRTCCLFSDVGVGSVPLPYKPTRWVHVLISTTFWGCSTKL